MKDPAEQLPMLGNTIAVALEKIFGEPMGFVLITLPTANGKVETTTNLKNEYLLDLLEFVTAQTRNGDYDTKEYEVAKQ